MACMRRAPLCVLLLLAACGKLDPPRVARVELHRPDERIDAKEDVRRSRAEESRIAALAFDAWSVPAGSERAVRPPATHSGKLRLQLGVDAKDARSVPPETKVRLGLRHGGEEASSVASIAEWAGSFGEIVLQLPRGVDELVLWTKIEGSSPAEAALVRGLFEIPLEWRDRPVPPADAPNILLLSIDTLRADRLGCYGYERGTTPNLDRLAAQGVLFERAYSSAPWTLPSYASLFTALLPADHRAGVVTEREDRFGTDEVAPKRTTELLRPDARTLAEAAREAGWWTAGFYCNPYIGAGAGVDRGFDRWERYQHGAKSGVDRAQAWIAAHGSRPWMVFLHLIDPHMPYAPPAPWDRRFAGVSVDELPDWPPTLTGLRAGSDAATRKLCSDLYDGEVAYADAELGRLLDVLRASGELDNTIVVLHSDHGEEFWEHGGCDHGHAMHEELLRVPFVLSWPGRVEPRRVGTRVRTLDLYPTLAELLSLPAPHPLAAGASLVPLLAADGEDREVVGEAILWGEREHKALLAGPLKYVATGSGGLAFELRATGLEPLDPSRGAALRQSLLERHRRTQAAERPRGVLRLDEASRNELSRIGYAGD
jgi:arylsulfatase A-like enzyme